MEKSVHIQSQQLHYKTTCMPYYREEINFETVDVQSATMDSLGNNSKLTFALSKK